MRNVIVDTNMLLVPGQHKVDIFSELDRVVDEQYTIIVLDKTMDELKNIIEGESGATGADKQAAKLALMLIEHQKKKESDASTRSNCKGLKIIQSSVSHADDAILAIAEDDALVATNDGDLKRRLLERGVRVIYLKQQQYLATD